MFCRFHSRPGYALPQLVEALRYKPEGRGLYSRWGHWNFSRSGSVVGSASSGNEYQGYVLKRGGERVGGRRRAAGA
jgi:hypothetical protein